MHLNDFNFHLPSELIARYPLATRTASKLLRLDGHTGEVQHQVFSDVLNLVEEGDLLVFNDTKVIPARLFGQKSTGGRVEILVERILDDRRMLAQVRASKSPRLGETLWFANNTVQFEVGNRVNQFYEIIYQQYDRTLLTVIESIGQIPLPPYMERLPDENDKERYQTVYARHKGSVAAPTAGFHFDEAMLQALRDKKVEMAYLTLHIGAGTFVPVRTENIFEHKMHTEYLDVPQDVCTKVLAAKARGKRVIAVGTTSMRALETACQSGAIASYRGDTNIFIYPGYQFRCVDVLITNLHLPCSTLLILLCAFAGHENVMRAYQLAVGKKYRFYSYGDAMWVTRLCS